jgi:hypothetical protein
VRVQAMPHVQRWLKRLQKVAADMPKEVVMFSNGKLSAMARTGRDAQNRDVLHANFYGSWDGGDF